MDLYLQLQIDSSLEILQNFLHLFEGKGPLATSGHRGEENSRMDLKTQGVTVWTGFIWSLRVP
jgi:hypothetical protein